MFATALTLCSFGLALVPFPAPEPLPVVSAGARVEGVETPARHRPGKVRACAALVAQAGAVASEGPGASEPGWWTGSRVAHVAVALAGVCVVTGAGVAVMCLQVRRAAALALRERAERARLEEQLKLAARLEAAGRLAGSVAHDFNNLLTVINGCTALLEAEIGEGNHPDRTRKFAAAIRRAGEQAASLTRQLLAFSRLRPVEPYPLDLNDVLACTADMLERLLGDRITVRLELGTGLPRVTAEPGLLSQVLLNLGVNAADAMPNGGTFTLATGAPEVGWVRLTLTDTGTGMSAEVKARAFEPGFTTKPAGKGTGLGLSTVHGIVCGLGGRIGLTSEPGRGTAFEIDLPVAPAAPAPPAGSTGEVALDATIPTVPRAPAVVLLVEDEEAVCVLLRHVLEAAGHTVLASGDPEDALWQLGLYHGALDLLLTDVVLPGMSGRVLADRVRELHPTAKVLFMSGYTAEEIREKGVSDEQADFLHKPFLPRELVERVTRVLDARPS